MMKKIFLTAQSQKIDQYTIQHEPISSLDLMERASKHLTGHILNIRGNASIYHILVGPGNNGGDGLAVARLLLEKGMRITVWLAGESKSPEAHENTRRLHQSKRQEQLKIISLRDNQDIPAEWPEGIYIDALFGSGLKRPLEGLYKNIVTSINKERKTLLAIDMPSGLFGEDNTHNTPDSIIRATHTFALEFPKLALFMPEYEDYYGQWHLVSFGLDPSIIKKTYTPFYLVETSSINTLLHKRKQQSHKGIYGHALLIAGSKGKGGAALLAAKACMRSGVGLLTTHIPQALAPILQGNSPETMISIDVHSDYWTAGPELPPFNAVGVGPGLGTNKETQKALFDLLEQTKRPMVLDADALNIIANKPDTLSTVPRDTILTPHPKEFDRLFGASPNHFKRIRKQLEKSQEHQLYIVLKGANTSTSTPEGEIFFNQTGNPGMGTAGSGDTLTGVILGLLAQQYTARDACLTGVHLHGLAGDIALRYNSYESLLASDISKHLGDAFNFCRNTPTTNLSTRQL